MEIDIIILVSNKRDRKFVNSCIESIDYCNKIFIINNHHNFVEKATRKDVHIFRNNGNGGFTDGNNLGLKYSNAKYVMLVNADIEFSKNCLEKLLNYMESHKRVGFVVPKLLKPWDKKTIDSTGIARNKMGAFYDRGRGEIDKGQFDSSENIFAGCGAALLFRREALEQIKNNKEYLDEDFFTYLEDVDICWRMGKRDWKGKFVSDAVAYHHRGHELEKPEKKNVIDFVINRIKQKKKDKYYKNVRRWVFRNNFWIIIKNQPLNFQIFPVLLGLFLRTIFSLIVEPYAFYELPLIIRKIPTMLKKRYNL